MPPHLGLNQLDLLPDDLVPTRGTIINNMVGMPTEIERDTMYRRDFLKTLAIGAAAVSPLSAAVARTSAPVTDLIIGKRILEVNGKPATVFGLTNRNGGTGLVLDAETQFNVRLLNETTEETLIHWSNPDLENSAHPAQQNLDPPRLALLDQFHRPVG